MTIQTELDTQGFVLVSQLASTETIAALIACLEAEAIDRSTRGGTTFGARNLLDLPLVRAFAESKAISKILAPILGSGFRAVRGLYFDKTPEANWPVAWHQDLTVAVKPQQEIAGWTNWSLKRGVPHAQPPADLLARLVTMRLHLDDCGLANGPLRVIAGSHATGVQARNEIASRSGEADVITANSGDALLMRPLILHASSAAQVPNHRRVLHLEFAPQSLLPNGLAWAAA